MKYPYLNAAATNTEGLPAEYIAPYYNDTLADKYEKLCKEQLQYHFPNVGLHTAPVTLENGDQKFWCDGLCLRGYMLASLAIRKDVAGVTAVLEDLTTMSLLTGHFGRWVRDAVSTDAPNGAWAERVMKDHTVSDAQYFEYSPYDSQYILWTDISRDQMYGLLYGLTMCKLCIDDEDVLATVVRLSEATYSAILADGYYLLNPDGSKPRHGDLTWTAGAEGALVTLGFAALTSEDDYTAEATFLRKLIVKYLPYDFTWFNMTNPNNQMMNNVGNYVLWSLTGESMYADNLRKQSAKFASYANPIWTAHGILANKDRAVDRELVSACNSMLKLFPDTKKLVDTKPNNNIPYMSRTNRYGTRTATTAVHPGYNMSFFTWTMDTRGIDGNNMLHGTTYYDTADFILAYHLMKKVNAIV